MKLKLQDRFNTRKVKMFYMKNHRAVIVGDISPGETVEVKDDIGKKLVESQKVYVVIDEEKVSTSDKPEYDTPEEKPNPVTPEKNDDLKKADMRISKKKAE